MRMIVFFDLPVRTKRQRKVATAFRNFLIKDGYFMIQYSIYCRVCNGRDAVEKHKARIYNNKPDNGSVRILVITEKMYENMEIVIGKRVREEDEALEHDLSVF